MAEPIELKVTLTRVDMHTFHIHGVIDGGTFMLRPMDRHIMDSALTCMGKICTITVKNAIIINVSA